jgi:hypothetical protein
MTPLVTPPTDNLYKFLAIAGMVLFVASLVVPMQLSAEFDRQTAHEENTIVEGELAIISVIGRSEGIWSDNSLASLTEEDFTLWNQGSDAARKEVAGKLFPPDGEPKLTTEQETIYKDALSRIYKMHYALERLARSLYHFSLVNRASRFAIVLGTFLMSVGFFLWWRRVQRWQDRATRPAMELPKVVVFDMPG